MASSLLFLEYDFIYDKYAEFNERFFDNILPRSGHVIAADPDAVPDLDPMVVIKLVDELGR